MLTKTSTFCKQRSVSFCISIVCIITLLLMVTFGFNFIKQFIYPEEVYQELENEAQRIIDEKDLNTEFEYFILYSNKQEGKRIEFGLQEAIASVIITVDNYSEDTQEISVNRQIDAITYYFLNIFAFAIFIIIVSVFGGMTLYVLLAIVSVKCRKRSLMLRRNNK